jgi:hypothetical protein
VIAVERRNLNTGLVIHEPAAVVESRRFPERERALAARSQKRFEEQQLREANEPAESKPDPLAEMRSYNDREKDRIARSNRPENLAGDVVTAIRGSVTDAFDTPMERITHTVPQAKKVFGQDVLTAACMQGAGCKWCWAKMNAKVHGRVTPQVLSWFGSDRHKTGMAKGLLELLGAPCRACSQNLPTAARGTRFR